MDIVLNTEGVRSHWEVQSDWMGQKRTVYTGSLFGCIEFVREHSESHERIHGVSDTPTS